MTPNLALIELMNRIELQLTLPAGAAPFSSYTRYYHSESPAVVVGTFVRGEGARKWLNSPSDAPRIKDGGCDIVNVRFDVPSNAITAVFCNGEA